MKHYKYLPRFDGELSTEKHMDDFEYFNDLFEIEHHYLFMRMFSHSLLGKSKTWFKNLQPESNSSWDELRETLLRFWVERKPWNLLLLELYGMSRMKYKTISNFSRIFSFLYYQMPKKIQPPEDVAKLHYATFIPPGLFLLLLERNSPYIKCSLMPRK